MAAYKKTIIKGKRKAIKSRAKTRRKLVVKTVGKSSEDAHNPPAQETANPPRRRNALGAIRVVDSDPLSANQPEKVSGQRSVTISKAVYERAQEGFDAPWDHAHADDTTEEGTSRNSVRMLKAMLLATLILSVFNSGAMVNWVRGLPAGPVEDRIILTAEVWHEWMEDEGLSDYMASARDYVQSLKERGW